MKTVIEIRKPVIAKTAPKVKQAKTVDSISLQPKGNYNRDKLAKAIAIHETGDCTAKVGAALKLNCFGFRANNTFYRFKTKKASYDKFHTLWATDYGDHMPTIREATAWVCGWHHLKENGTVPCAGGNPHSWLVSVTAIYSTL